MYTFLALHAVPAVSVSGWNSIAHDWDKLSRMPSLHDQSMATSCARSQVGRNQNICFVLIAVDFDHGTTWKNNPGIPYVEGGGREGGMN
jgi:hypothetical protein